MSIKDPNTITEWLLGLPIPWLVGGPVGVKDASSYGYALDQQVELQRAAIKARFPDYADDDGKAQIGADRFIIRGPLETDENYATRLKYAWESWERAGTFLELLLQLYWIGYPDAVIVQQNGLKFSLTNDPTPDGDPFALALLSATNTALLPAPLTSGVNPAAPVIPAGTPWFSFDTNTEFGSRFAIMLPSIPLSWLHHGVATFTGTSTATVTWCNPFDSTAYDVMVGPPETADGPVTLTVTSQTTTGCTVVASGAFTGTADVIGWASGENPFEPNPSSVTLGRLRSVVRTWKPARSTCVKVYVFVSGAQWAGFNWGGATWGGDVREYTIGEF
jgi:hypothetical protein